jgi:DNA polymerase-1
VKRLPLYEERPKLAVETTAAMPLDSACTRCQLHDRARVRCQGPRFVDGDPSVGTLLVVIDGVTLEEDRLGSTYRGEVGLFVQRMVGKFWKGRVVLDVATRCPAGKDGASEAAVNACRPYLATTLRDAGVTRVLVAGANAALSVYGRSVPAFTNRRGYGFVETYDQDEDAATPRLVPVFPLFHPLQAIRNGFLRKMWEEDLRWALETTPVTPPWDGSAYVVETAEDAREAMAVIRSAPRSAFDIETAAKMFTPTFRMLSLAVAPAVGERKDAYVWTEEALKDPETRRGLLAWLADERAPKAGQNGKYDALGVLAAYGVWTRGLSVDVRLWRKLLDPEAEGKLHHMAELVGMGGMKEENIAHKEPIYKKVSQLFGKRTRARNSKKNPHDIDLAEEFMEMFGVDRALAEYMADKDNEKESWGNAVVPKPVLYRYNARDAVATIRVADLLEPIIDAAPALRRTWDRVVRGASEAIVQVEAWGVAADREAILTLQKFLDVREAELREKLRGHADINWGSRQQVAEFFFKKCGLPPVKQTKSGDDSTDAEALEELAKLHPAAALLMDLRSVDKLNGTYARGLLPHVRSDGRIHPSFLLDGARSGRTSCQNPNLQNQPRPDSPEAKMVRDIFIAPPGKRLVQLDYSQLELRIACALSGDEEMLRIFLSGVDYHQRTAELIAPLAWGIQPEQVEKKHRSFAKTINFGLLYGKGDKTIAEEFGCSVQEAAKIRAAILGRFRKLAAWCKEREQEARLTGEVWTTWAGQPARRRPLWRIGDADDFVRSVALHGAVNSPVQGSANEYGVASLTECVNWILSDAVPAKLVLYVHDSLMFEVDEDAVEEVIYQGRRIMTSWDSNGVPLVVDAETGPAWGSLEKVKESA